MNKVTKTFSTKQGVVTLSTPFFTLMHEQQQVEATYTQQLQRLGHVKNVQRY
jgi:hypothetical protein